MKRFVLKLVSLALLLPVLGCAGGWRNGAPPEAALAPAAAVTSSRSIPANATPASATQPTPDGALFVFTGAATSVHVAGEFNSWSTSTDALVKQTDGKWTLKKKLSPGRYLYKFVLDGGTWKEDAGAKETADDGFGGKNSVVVVGTGGAAPATAMTPAPAAPATAKPVTGKPSAPQISAAGVLFTYAGAARSVALCGAFNQWAPNADPMLHQADGTWTITKKLPAGSHAYKFLVDGAQWKTDDANAEGQDDGFGGKNSLVTVK